KSNAAGHATAIVLPGSWPHQRVNSGIAASGSRRLLLTSSQAACWVSHHAIVSGSGVASSSGYNVEYQVPVSSHAAPSSLRGVNAAAPSESMELRPGAGPSV